MSETSPRFTWQLRAATKGPTKVAVFVRAHAFDVGAPLQFDVDDDRISALEYALGALAADLVGGLRARATRQRVAIDDVEAAVEVELDNPLTYLDVVGEEGRPSMSNVRIRVYAKSLDEEARVRRVWDDTLQKSPLVTTLQEVVHLELTLHIIF